MNHVQLLWHKVRCMTTSFKLHELFSHWGTMTTISNNNLLHLYSAFLGTQSALHSKGDISTCKVSGSSRRFVRDCRLGEWMSSALSTFNTTTEVRPLSKTLNPQLLPGQHRLPTALGVCSRCVCVCLFTSHCCVCALGWVKCRAQIPSMEHHTWTHVTSFAFPCFS